MIWDLLIIGHPGKKPRLEGLYFDLAYAAQRIGSGRMLRLDGRGDEGSSGSVAEKSGDGS